jgi:hypothetical protein
MTIRSSSARSYSSFEFITIVNTGSNPSGLLSLKKTFLDLYNFQHAIRKKYKDVPKFPLGKDDEESLDEKTLAGFRNFL